jgi:hypothetical protein
MEGSLWIREACEKTNLMASDTCPILIAAFITALIMMSTIIFTMGE